MASTIKLGEMSADVILKDIKNIHLSVYPPVGRVRISAPTRMSLDTIRVYAISKLGWIKQQQKKFIAQNRETPREYLDRESHYYLGKRYLMKPVEHCASAGVFIRHGTIEVHQRGSSSPEKAQNALQSWYREQIRQIGGDYVSKWEPKLGVTIAEYGIKAMKTKWGTCNPVARRIWLNLELVKKPRECIEYIVVHELVHLLSRKHDDKFIALMNSNMPKWKFYREELNRMPLRHENWAY